MAQKTNQEILTKAIEKAIAGGWRVVDVRSIPAEELTLEHIVKKLSNDSIIILATETQKEYVMGVPSLGKWETVRGIPVWDNTQGFHQLIFNHDFAKTFWGEEPRVDLTLRRHGTLKNYEFHLACMVLADDPIKYLGEHI